KLSVIVSAPSGLTSARMQSSLTARAILISRSIAARKSSRRECPRPLRSTWDSAVRPVSHERAILAFSDLLRAGLPGDVLGPGLRDRALFDVVGEAGKAEMTRHAVELWILDRVDRFL